MSEIRRELLGEIEKAFGEIKGRRSARKATIEKKGWDYAQSVYDMAEEAVAKEPVVYKRQDPLARALGKVDTKTWDAVVREQLRERGLEYANDEIYEVILRLAGSIAADRIETARQKYAADAKKEIQRVYDEDTQRRLVYRQFVDILTPLMALGLMLGDEIVSVAVRDSNGGIRVLSVDGPDPRLD